VVASHGTVRVRCWLLSVHGRMRELDRPLLQAYRDDLDAGASPVLASIKQPVRLAGGWWLVLVCSERKILLTGH
jgi:hypothetical protein